MRQACRLFSGTHNFSAFRGKGCQQENTVKTIRDIQVAWRTEGLFTYLEIPIEGSGFLKNMVRIMVGTLVEIGRGRFEEDTICQALESGSRGKAGLTAPAKGLILDRIFFDPDPFEERRLETWNLP
ncbi:MAG: hypothetical protein GY866_27050 [Proteobacteria bacterium]|nr:hypothetical protein [Pseudomonadota bacterium]